MQDLLEKAQAVMQHSYSPYSCFQVGVGLRAESGAVYAGCNVENISYDLTICAEGSAITQMVSAGEQSIAELVIVSSGEDYCFPCGACRQRIHEFSKSDVPVYCFNAAGDYKKLTINELLPHSFQFEK